MKSTTLGLLLTLLGSAALGNAAVAQTPPPANPPPAVKPPDAAKPVPPAPPQAPPVPQGQQGAQNGQPAIPTPSGPPEGMIVETPNGFFLVRPGDPNPRRLDLGGMRQGGPAMAEGDDAMGDTAEGGPQPPPPPRPRRPPPPPQSKGASLHIHAPNLDVDVKCPDDEPVKACVDAVSQLMDKANAAAH